MGILGGVVKSRLVTIAVICLVATAGAQLLEQEVSQRPRALVYALEGLGALGGTVCGAFGGGCTGCLAGAMFVGPMFSGSFFENYNTDWDAWGYVMLGIGAVVIPVSSGVAVSKVGSRLGEHGSRGSAIGGAYVGALVGAGIACLGFTASQSDAVHLISGILAGSTISAGAVVGYNLGNTGEAGTYQPELGSRLQPPAVALTSVELSDHSMEYGVKVQLAGLRF
jgi:hypothetical protein